MWPQLLTFAVGIWVMASPGVLEMGERASTVAWVVGPSAASFALVAAFEVLRSIRVVNVIWGGLLAVSPLLGGYNDVGTFSAVVGGTALALLSLPGGRTKQRYAGGWKDIVKGKEGRWS